MTLYCGIDLHSNNHVICVIDDNDKRLFEQKLGNYPELPIRALAKYKKRLKAIAIESTFNWYWLADALMGAGFQVALVNTAKVIQDSGLKRTNDRYDAFYLAHLMRLGILPTGYIYPKSERGLRDLSIFQSRNEPEGKHNQALGFSRSWSCLNNRSRAEFNCSAALLSVISLANASSVLKVMPDFIYWPGRRSERSFS